MIEPTPLNVFVMLMLFFGITTPLWLVAWDIAADLWKNR